MLLNLLEVTSDSHRRRDPQLCRVDLASVVAGTGQSSSMTQSPLPSRSRTSQSAFGLPRMPDFAQYLQQHHGHYRKCLQTPTKL